MKQSRLVNILLLAALICVALYQFSTTANQGYETEPAIQGTYSTENSETPERSQPSKNQPKKSSKKSHTGKFPDYVIKTLEHVQQTGKAPKGYVGGRRFQNREKRLPRKDKSGQKMEYQEWDVHKKVKGKNRGAERLVTSANGRAWFTKDHYRTFKEIN